MRKYNIPPAFSSSLQLGRQGENGVTEITFLCAGYAKMYGDGFAEAVHRTPDGTTYPVNIEQDENNRVSWLISDGDTATAGTGQLELRWMVNGNLAKSNIFSTIIKSALTAPETPPDAAKSWVDKVLKAAEDIKEGAIDDEKLAKAIAEYFEKHPIESGITEQNAREIAQSVVDAYQEKDPTVPDWAKAETKPTYTAAEVGAVPESAKTDIDKNTAARHTHSNKSALDSISESDIAKWNSGTAGTVEITGATGLAAGSAPTVTEAADSTAQARKYQLGIPAGKDGADGAKGDKGETGAKGDKGEQGADGKSAYQYAVEGGYTGTEADFAAKLAAEKFANPNALTFTGAVTGSYDGSEALTVEIPSGGGSSSGSGKAKSQILINQEITELTASLSVTLDHDFHNLTAIINSGPSGAALTADSDGTAVASKIGLIIDSTAFSYNSRKVAYTETNSATWQTIMICAEWSDDLSVFKRGFKVDVVTGSIGKYYDFSFGGTSAMYGTIGTDDNSPKAGKTANIVVNGAYLNVGTRVVMWGEYYE